LPAARIDDVAIQAQATFGELRGYLSSGEVGEQGGREEIHDGEVIGRLVSGQIAEQRMAGMAGRR
jgi:hypothetical protein